MGTEEILAEIDRRIKRLEAEIELLEEQIEREERVRELPKAEDRTSFYYLLFMGVWILLGAAALVYVQNRTAPSVGLPVGLYVLIGLITVGVPLAYLLWSRGRGEGMGLEERLAGARVTIARFYRPLREAVEKGDREAMIALADRLLEEPGLAAAVEVSNEGDPKLNAYALYLYASYRPELEGEVRETIEKLTNRPLKVLLSGLLGREE